ncbi:T9SS type A sorting domain-containing protein [Christiangramia echinicola]|uniref:Por secretion system C-terminal sorting domain-containing protein n=1 Tax=Christiangramia echinicola TaxID=279359 RepID=A0A1H1RY72_9FLAO|nr:T9SS type A sorting domain-containing protein [Christiangramia echinicola]SDS40650.1 Por secretion system C-terminal sorting domain-containing protein [Christiangramia echinicola]
MLAKPTKTFFCNILLSILITGVSISAYSQTKTSDGIGNWQDIAWSPTGVPEAFNDVKIENDSVIIPEGTTVTVNDLEVGKDGNLIVYGNLIVKGNLSMSNNSIGYTMGPSSTVVVYGNFSINNKVELSLSSYLVVYGDFTNNGSSNQGDLNIDDASIYIFGEVSGGGFPEDFGCGSNYSGSTPDVEENCDYGNETDFEENQDEIPDEIVDLINCFDLSSIASQEVCPGQNTTFNVSSYPDVNYQWQEKTPGESTDWSPVGTNGNQLQILNTTFNQSGNKYRVVVTPVATDAACKISISRTVSLTISSLNYWTGITSSDWNTASNWSCNTIPSITSNVIIPNVSTNYPVLSTGATGMVNNVSISNNATLTILSNTLQIGGVILNNGSFDSTTGTIELVGSNSIDIPANTFLNNQIQNLTVNNIAGVTLLGPTSVTGTVFLNNGNLISNGNLTLQSDALQTALIDGSGSGEVIGTVHMQRYLDNSFGYKYFSSPFSNTMVDDFSGYVDLNSSFPHFYSYNENREDAENNDVSGWEPYTTVTNPINTLEGYALNFGGSTNPETIEISGNVNNGSYNRTLQNNNGLYTKGYSLAGNPYPSPIDWDATAGWTRNNIDDAIYFYSASTDDQYTGTYTSYVNGLSSSGSSSASIIPSMQGFFVKVSEGFTSGTLGVTNEVRINNFSQNFYRNQDGEIDKNNKSLIRLKAGYDDYELKDAMVIYFSPYAKLKFEKDKDAFKIMNTNVQVPNIYSLDPFQKKLSVIGIPHPDGSEIERIPLGINVEKEGWLIIELSEIENISGNLLLIDKDKRIVHDLKDNNEFRVYLKKGIYESRFELVFSENFINNEELIFKDPIMVWNENNLVQVKLTLDPHQEGLIRAISVTGQTLEQRQVKGSETLQLEGIKSSGLYFIVLTTAQGKHTKKVLIKL